MKKVIALLLCICCMCAALSLSVAAKNGNNEVDLIVNTSGENIEIEVKTNFACGSLQGSLLSDADVQYKDVAFESAIDSNNRTAPSETLPNGSTSSSIRSTEGVTRFAFVGDVNSGTSGKWATISYTGNNSKFNLGSFKVYAANKDKMDADVYIVFRGDANTDGSLDIRDLFKFKKTSNLDTPDIEEIYKKNIDVDGNGTWESDTDMQAFRNYLLGVMN